MNRVLIGIGLFILLLWPGLCPAAEPAPETPSEQSAAAAYDYRDPLFRDTPRGALQALCNTPKTGITKPRPSIWICVFFPPA